MIRIIADIPVSLDGFVTGPDPTQDNGLGTGGEALHTCWDDTSGYGAGEVGKPAFVAAARGLDIDRDAPDLRRLPVIR